MSAPQDDLDALIAEALHDVRQRLAALQERLDVIRAARAGANDDDEHDPEGSTLSTEWSRAEGQRADAEKELADLDGALERRRAGSYGICVSCGQPIPIERLRLRPAAVLCVPCASRL